LPVNSIDEGSSHVQPTLLDIKNPRLQMQSTLLYIKKGSSQLHATLIDVGKGSSQLHTTLNYIFLSFLLQKTHKYHP